MNVCDGLRSVPVLFIAPSVRSCFGLTACRNIASASLMVVVDFSMMIQVCVGPLPWLTRSPVTLLGWSGLVRRDPCEWLTAATPLKFIGFAAEDFYTLEAEAEPLRDG